MAGTKNYFLGIEYSKERVKCALAKFDGKKYEVYGLQIFEEDEGGTSLQKLSDWKKEVIGEEKVKAIVSISESLIFLKELTVPNVKREALDEAIYWELSSASPLPPSQAIYEWMPIHAEKDELSVVAMAVRDNQIDLIVDELEKVNIEVVTIEPASIALSRAAGENYDKNTMLLLVGAAQTDIVVMKNGMPVFSTTSDVKLKREKSEKWKLSKTVSEEIAQNTKDLITFWETHSGAKIEQVLITGDLVDKYFGLAASINKFANVPVIIARQRSIPALSFKDIPKAYINRYFISIGALARFLGDIYEGVNLIPTKKRIEVKSELVKNAKLEKLRTLNYLFGVYLLALIFSGIVFWGIRAYYDGKIRETRKVISSHPGQSFVEVIRRTNIYLAKIDELSAKHEDQGVTLRKISEMTPSDISLTAVNFNNEKTNLWKIEGKGSREAVLAYYQKLAKESGAREVTMPYSNLDSDTENEFEIDIIW